MARSQNGWAVLPYGSAKLHTWTEPDSGITIRLRNGSAGFVLVFFLSWFHKKVERVNEGQKDDWGHAVREIREGVQMSNHASGTAEDINATQHPLGVATSRTFTALQQRRIRRKLRYFFLGVIRWGGDYSNRPDAMHFEINKGLAATERLAKALMKTPRGRRILKANPGQRAVIKS